MGRKEPANSVVDEIPAPQIFFIVLSVYIY